MLNNNDNNNNNKNNNNNNNNKNDIFNIIDILQCNMSIILTVLILIKNCQSILELQINKKINKIKDVISMDFFSTL